MGHPSARLAATIDWRFLENASGRSIRISPPSAAADAADGGLNRPKGGQFIAHVKALPGTPCDGHTLGPSLAETETRAVRACPASWPTWLSRPQRAARPQNEDSHLR